MNFNKEFFEDLENNEVDLYKLLTFYLNLYEQTDTLEFSIAADKIFNYLSSKYNN